MRRKVLPRHEAIPALDRRRDRRRDFPAVKTVDPAVPDLIQHRREVWIAKQHPGLHRRVEGEGALLAPEPSRRGAQRVRKLRGDEVAVLGESGRCLDHRPQPERAETFEQPPPCLDRAGDGNGERSSRRHRFISAGADRGDGG